MVVEKINPDTLARPVLDLYAQIVVSCAPRLAFISGQVALDEHGVLIGVQTLGLPEWLIEIDAVAALDP
jgi:enamine deaminase RidA (YjgF/YER057c/UK114 family)